MLLGVSRQSVAKWEAGQSTPEIDKLVKMADLFGCTLDELEAVAWLQNFCELLGQ